MDSGDGTKVLKPQEALVLTLFGKYIGTLKNEGFYYVNPFCVSVNPAAKTKLNQSGDVDGGAKNTIVYPSVTTAANIETINKKISLKIMTLNNNRQKIRLFGQPCGDRHCSNVACSRYRKSSIQCRQL